MERRPISRPVLAESVPTENGRHVPVVELIPPLHKAGVSHGAGARRVRRAGAFGEFVDPTHRPYDRAQFRSSVCAPVYCWFPYYTHVKVRQRSLREACELEGATCDRFTHAEWLPEPLGGPLEVECARVGARVLGAPTHAR